MDAIEVVNCDLDSCLVGDCRKMNQSIGGSTCGGMHDDCILERFSREDVTSGNSISDQFDDLLACRPRITKMLR